VPSAGNMMFAVGQVLVPPGMQCWCMSQMDFIIASYLPLHLVTNRMLIKWTLHTCQASLSDAQHDLSCPVISNRDLTPASCSANCNTKQSGMSLMSVDEAPLVHIGAWRHKNKPLLTHQYQSMSRHSFRLCPASSSRSKFA